MVAKRYGQTSVKSSIDAARQAKKSTVAQAGRVQAWSARGHGKIEAIRKNFDRKLRMFRSQLVGAGRKSPKFRIPSKMSKRHALFRAMQFKLRALHEIDEAFIKEVGAIPLEARQTLKDLISSYKQEEALYSDALQEQRTSLSDAKNSWYEVTRAAAITKITAKVGEVDRLLKTHACESAQQIPEALWGHWDAKCDGYAFSVSVDGSSGLIAGDNYSEKFTIVSNNEPGKKFAIPLKEERWELSSKIAKNRLTWIGMASGSLSVWTRSERS